MWKFLVSYFFIVSPLFSESYLNNSSYIAQRGFGETEQIAQENALASLSKYFQMNVSVEAEERTIVKDSSSNRTTPPDKGTSGKYRSFSYRRLQIWPEKH